MIIKSAVLPLDFVLCDKSDNDTEPKLRECVNLRLGPSILDKIKLNTNTQKVESANQTRGETCQPTPHFQQCLKAYVTVPFTWQIMDLQNL